MKNKYKSEPRKFDELPREVQSVCVAFSGMLQSLLSDVIFGMYLYGAALFLETDYIVDIDSHIILRRPLPEDDKEKVKAIHKSLVDKYQSINEGDLDVWYILLDDIKSIAPVHQVNLKISDMSWSLHRAHMLAGYCIALLGPEPKQFLSEPTWQEITVALDHEYEFIMNNYMKYPAYCVLNSCRLMYSHRTKDVVISKRGSADWAIENYPSWENLINAAVRQYRHEKVNEDKKSLETETIPFLAFAKDVIDEYKQTDNII